MSIKLFTVANVGHCATGTRTVSLSGEEGFTIHESWREVQDLAELKQALRNIISAAHVACWWNFSFKVLEVFLHNNDFFEKELSGVKRAQVLSGFCDHVFKKNADSYIREAEFLDLPRLQATWNSWWSARKAGLKQNENTNQGNQSGQKQQYKQFQRDKKQKIDYRSIPFISKPPSEASICKRFSENKCSNEHYACSIMTNTGRKRLYHLCAAEKVDPSGKKSLCLDRHSKKDHK